jgi:hypothetical protein
MVAFVAEGRLFPQNTPPGRLDETRKQLLKKTHPEQIRPGLGQITWSVAPASRAGLCAGPASQHVPARCCSISPVSRENSVAAANRAATSVVSIPCSTDFQPWPGCIGAGYLLVNKAISEKNSVRRIGDDCRQFQAPELADQSTAAQNSSTAVKRWFQKVLNMARLVCPHRSD